MILYKNKLLLFSKDAFNLNNRKTSWINSTCSALSQ